MNLEARRPELEGYAEAVREAKEKGTVFSEAGSWAFLMAIGLLWASLQSRDWDIEPEVRQILFSMAGVCGVLAFSAALNIADFPASAEQRRTACVKLAQHLNWSWQSMEIDKAGNPLTPGRLSGQAAGIPFVMETSKTKRELRFNLPKRDLAEPSARDFYDLQEVEYERKRRNSLAGLPGKAGILFGPVGKALGRDRSATLDGDTLCIRCTPYKEKGQSPDANIRRRMREAEAILALAEAIRDDWLADFDLS